MIARIYPLALALATLALVGCPGVDVGDLFGPEGVGGGGGGGGNRSSTRSAGSGRAVASSSGGGGDVGDCLRSPSGSYCACTVACAAALGIPEGACLDGTLCERPDAGADADAVAASSASAASSSSGAGGTGGSAAASTAAASTAAASSSSSTSASSSSGVSPCHVAPANCATVADCAAPCAASCGLAPLLCNYTNSACYCGEAGDGGVCLHGVCALGVALDPYCDPCAAVVCATDLSCCTQEWTANCILVAQNACDECGP